MAGVSTPESASPGGKKNVDFQLNLVPFIDLLSVLISFLLMTAVWTQISKIDVKSQDGPVDPIENSDPPEAPVDLRVLVTEAGYAVSTKGKVIAQIDRRNGVYDLAALSETLERIASAHPENRKIHLTCEDRVAYDELIGVMDKALEHGLEEISVGGVDT